MKREIYHGSMCPRNKRPIGFLAVSALLMTAVFEWAERLEAAVIYSNLGPNDSFATSPGTYPIWFLTSGGFIQRAASFTVPGSQNVPFGSADLGFHLQSGTNSANVKLAANGSGNVPGATIESINISLPPPSANPTIVSAMSNTNPTLTPGTTYWIIASVNFSGTMATWGPNNTGALGGNATRTNFQNGQWFSQGPGGVPSLRINTLMIPSFTADFDDDGDVDAADLARWRNDFGPNNGSDADDDRDSDGHDFLVWQRQHGSVQAVSSSTTASAAVPEPATIVLVAATGLVVGLRNRYSSGRL
jgi:hypothetical protein